MTALSSDIDPRRDTEAHAGILSRLGGQISRDTLIYSVGMAMVFPFSLIQVAVLTRYLAPADYGNLSLLLIAAGALTLLMTMGILQGTLRRTYGFGGDDGDDGGVDDLASDGDLAAPTDIVASLREKQVTLSTGVMLITVSALAMSVPVVVAAPWIAGRLLHNSSASVLVVWACMSAVAGAVFRMTHNVLRMDRRPYQFVAMSTLRPILVVGLAWLFVARGLGVKGVLMGTTAGTALTAIACIAVARRNYRPAIVPSEARAILSAGRGYLTYILALFLVHNLDTLLLSRYASAGDVGIYRVASRIASVPSYLVSAYLLAQVPLMRSTIMLAADAEVGKRRTRSLMLTYFIISAVTVVLAISLAADFLVQVAAPSYSEAATLVPVLGVSFMAYAAFIVVFRSTSVGSRWLRVILLLASLAVMMALAPVLIPTLGGYGAAMGTSITMGAATLFLLWKAAQADDPFEPQARRMVGAIVLAVVCWVLATRIPTGGATLAALIDGLAFVAFIILLAATGAVPTEHLAILRSVAASALRDLTGRHRLARDPSHLPPRQRTVVEAVALGSSVEEISARERIPEAQVRVRLVRGLRTVTGLATTTPSPLDDDIGSFLLAPPHAALRDDLVHRLVADGADPLELHDLATTLAALRRKRSPARAARSQRHAGG